MPGRIRRTSAPRPVRSALLLPLLSLPLGAQAPADSYLPRYNEVRSLAPDPQAVGAVRHLVLRRDVMELELDEGTMVLLPRVSGQAVGAAFTGSCRIRYRPSIEIERERMQRFNHRTALDEPCEQVVLFFADSTLAQLEAGIRFGPGKVPDGLKDKVREAISYLDDEEGQSLDEDVFRPLLNGERTGMFYAHVIGSGDPWMFLYDPGALESVQLLTRARGMLRMGRYAESVARHRPLPDTTAAGITGERLPDAYVRRYTMQLRLARTGTADLSFNADAELEITSDTATGPWLAFGLYPKLQVDSASWAGAGPAEVFKGKESGVLWVRLPERLAAGATQRLRLSYHGDLVDRLGDWFYVKSSIAWYPLPQDNRHLALFDLTFTTPEDLLLASVGTQVDSQAAGSHTLRTHWTTARPIRNASFNLGIFEAYHLAEPEVPPVTVLWSERMHSAVSANAGRIGGIPGKNMDKEVGADVVSALRFFQQVYGPIPVSQFYATEIPALHGEAFPGLINISFVTFIKTDEKGVDEQFRAHEVAHQWWGISVDYATYRDRWLSEGFADFSGLWYLQTRRKSNDRYFDILDRWRADILERRDDPAPIWLGHRVGTATSPDDYSAIVYQKGAWVLHMLRMLLLDLKSMNEDRFTGVMQAFYQAHAGGLASTDDFRRALEEKTGQPMGWFFDQWVYGSDIPTYKVAWNAVPAENGQFQVQLKVDQERVPPTFLAYVPVAVDLGDNKVARFRVKVTGAHSDLTLPPVPAKPKKVTFNDLHGVLAEVKTVSW